MLARFRHAIWLFCSNARIDVADAHGLRGGRPNASSSGEAWTPRRPVKPTQSFPREPSQNVSGASHGDHPRHAQNNQNSFKNQPGDVIAALVITPNSPTKPMLSAADFRVV